MQKSFYILFFLAHLFLLISFQSPLPFWIIFSLSFLILTILATIFGTYEWKYFSIPKVSLSIVSGLIMYGLFFIGKSVSSMLFPTLLGDVAVLYDKVKPTLFLHYLLLFIIIIPGEELFWRGFIQKKLEAVLQKKNWVVFVSALLYTSANLYTWNPLFLLATFVGGIIWGGLYMWNRNIILTILSHLVFNLFFLVLLPLF
ncbi:CPBP family intramembrane glutamic endopeptidase [Fredinandcohnia humi]